MPSPPDLASSARTSLRGPSRRRSIDLLPPERASLFDRHPSRTLRFPSGVARFDRDLISRAEHGVERSSFRERKRSALLIEKRAAGSARSLRLAGTGELSPGTGFAGAAANSGFRRRVLSARSGFPADPVLLLGAVF